MPRQSSSNAILAGATFFRVSDIPIIARKPVLGPITHWFAHAVMLASASLITLWMVGAIYYDVCQGAKAGRLIAVGWAIGVIFLFAAWPPLWQPFVALLCVTALFTVWWVRQKPSHNRDLDPSVAVLPRVVREGDRITIENVRNFEYRSLDDFTPCYESRTFRLANLQCLDIVFFNWGSPGMSHPVMVFDFGPDGRICVSIEVRYRQGQKYSILRSFYRQKELIFVVADERDVILRRTKYGEKQAARLYHLNVGPLELRTVFLDYITEINSLFETPRWYHGLCANCTTTHYRLPHSRFRRDWRVIANARLDRALYDDGRLDQMLPFAELSRLAYLNDIAIHAPKDGFGDHIRRELERLRHERRRNLAVEGT